MADQALPSPAVNLIKGKDDLRPDDTWYQRLSQMWTAYNQTAADVATAAANLASEIASGADARITATYTTQGHMESEDAGYIVSPDKIKYAPSALKAHGLFNFAGSASEAYNISSITDSGTGIIDIGLTTAFSSANWSALCTPQNNGASTVTIRTDAAQSSSTVRIGSWNMSSAAADVSLMNFGAAGDQ